MSATTSLTLDKINALLAKKRVRGLYDKELAVFLDSGEAGKDYSLVEGIFQGKAAVSIASGFNNAIDRSEDKAAKDVVVIRDDDENAVALINRKLL
jgi:hypothetical protein